MKDPLEYTTLYMPYDGQLGARGSRLIYDTAIDWLYENVGSGTLVFHQWLIGAEHRLFEWCYHGLDHSPASDFTAITRVFHFRDPDKAMLFKLTWG